MEAKEIKLESFYTNYIGLNRFLVKFPKELEICEWMIKSFKKPKYYFATKSWGAMELCIGAVFSSDEKNWHPYMKDSEIIKNFERYNDMNFEYIDFEELDTAGKAINKIRYTNPKFISIRFEEHNYDDGTQKEFTLEMIFDEVIELE